VTTLYTTTSDGYFAAVGARLLAGRDFTAGESETSQPVSIINDVLARQLFGEPAAAVGQTVRFQFMRGPVVSTVVGVVEAIRYGGLRAELKPELYQHYRQTILPPGTLVYRSTGSPVALVPGIRAVLARVDPSSTVTLDRWGTFDDRLTRAIAQPRFFLVLIGVFAAAALLLAAFGIHGTLSFWVAERRRELGIRLALGADRRAIARLVIGRGLRLAMIGIACGLAISLASGRLVAQLLFEVSPADPLTLAAAAAALLALAALVCGVPARRATRLDPVATLRAD
jgi:putative ABC transport system permease protein